MKIEKVEVFGIAMPMIGEYKNAYLTKTVQKSPVVRITAGGPGLGVTLDDAKLETYRLKEKAAA